MTDEIPTNLPIDPLSPLVIGSLALLLMSLALWPWLRRLLASRRARHHLKSFSLPDIHYAAEMERVGPLRAWEMPNAFTASAADFAQSIDQALSQANARSIALVGALAGAGVTTVAIATARHFARAGRRTLLIDLNFERPMVQLSTGALNKPGISNLLHTGSLAGLVTPDPRSNLDIVGVGTLAAAITHAGRIPDGHLSRLRDLIDKYERVVFDAATLQDHERCDLATLLRDSDLVVLICDIRAQGASADASACHRHNTGCWHPACTRHTYNHQLAKDDGPATTSTAQNLRPVDALPWIQQQADECYTLKLTELRYRPMLTRRQVANYAGHQVACVQLTVLGEITYLLILGCFETREEALRTARSLGLNHASVHALRFADVKKGIQLENQRRRGNPSIPPRQSATAEAGASIDEVSSRNAITDFKPAFPVTDNTGATATEHPGVSETR